MEDYKPNLPARLEAVKELKAEWGIGTQRALNYLRADREYTELRNRVVSELNQQGWVDCKPSVRSVANACQLLEYTLNRTIHDELVGRLFPEDCTKGVTFGIGSPTVDKARVTDGRGYGDGLCVLYNIETVLVTYWAGLAKTQDFERSVADAISKALFKIEGNDVKFGDISSSSVDVVMVSPDGLMPHEDEFLLGPSGERTYDAAVKEHTLGRIETERRIAVNTMLEYKNLTIDKVLGEIGLGIKKRQETLDRLHKCGAPPLFLLNKIRNRQDREKYTKRAIITNREWLERFLAS